MSAELSEDARSDILQRDILPLHFPVRRTPGPPSLVLLAGQPGAARSRVVSQLLAEYDGDLAVVQGEDLRAFHPHLLALRAARTEDADEELGTVVAGWVQGCIRHARENQRSLLLEGAFLNPDTPIGAAARFADAGFQSRVVVVGVRRAESLLAETSRHLRAAHAGDVSTFAGVDAHDDAFHATRALVTRLEAEPAVDRLTVVDRTGAVVFDRTSTDSAEGFAGAEDALVDAQSTRLGQRDATQWLSELKHVTQFAQTRRVPVLEVQDALVELHEIALREVIPELHIPADGVFASAIEDRTQERLAVLREAQRVEERLDAPGPVLIPGGPDRGIGL